MIELPIAFQRTRSLRRIFNAMIVSFIVRGIIDDKDKPDLVLLLLLAVCCVWLVVDVRAMWRERISELE